SEGDAQRNAEQYQYDHAQDEAYDPDTHFSGDLSRFFTRGKNCKVLFGLGKIDRIILQRVHEEADIRSVLTWPDVTGIPAIVGAGRIHDRELGSFAQT